MPLFRLHAKDTGIYRDIPGRLVPKPCMDKYRFAEQASMMLLLTARHDGILIGYYIAFVQPAIHYADTLFATTDLPYIHPHYRHRGIGVRLFLAAEKRLKARGVKLWQSSSKIDSQLHPSMDRLLRHQGFAPSDLTYSKWLGD